MSGCYWPKADTQKRGVMTLEFLGDIGDLVGGVGVVVTLIYLAIQIKKNSLAVQMTALQMLQNEANQAAIAVASNPDLAKILVDAENGIDNLSPVGRCQVDYFATQFFETYESAYHMLSRGHIDHEIWAAWKLGFQNELTSAFLEFWGVENEDYVPDFRKFVETCRRDRC
jgi:hypothetical protein